MDCLAAPTHYPGECILGIAILQHHSTAKALFAAPRTYPASPCLFHTFARVNKDVNHFCLCRAETAGASELLCTGATLAKLIVCVW